MANGTTEGTAGDLLAGLVVVNLSTNTIGAHVAQLYADFGAEVWWIEPPGGSPLRSQPAWPFWARGARSVELDLRDPADNAAARKLLLAADVAIETFRPGVLERLGLGYDELAVENPGLILASVTAYGRTGPMAHLKGYEGVVMAKLGAFTQLAPMVERDGPAFASTPYCSFSAAMLAIQGTLAALLERRSSGVGQHVDTNLLQGLLAHDVAFSLMNQVSARMMAAMAAAPPPAASTSPAAPARARVTFGLMTSLTSDGRWLQFSQQTPRQGDAFIKLVGLWDEWDEIAASGDPVRVAAFTDRMHEAVHSRTLAEWLTLFDEDPNVFAETYRQGSELLHHPQLVHDGRVVEVHDAERGAVRQAGPLVAMTESPGRADLPVPALDEHRSELDGVTRRPAAAVAAAPSGGLPLDGYTVLELATFYAAPYGASVLADLGARVIKVEQVDGDPLRWLIPIPEVGAVKAMLGKESVAVDMQTDEGREIVLELAKRSDVVLQSFRAGVADRLGIDEASLRAVNPRLAYHNGPGFGVAGPYGHRPAYAPTISAASGMAARNIGPHVPSDPSMTIPEIMATAGRLATANMSVGTADGFGAVGVAAALTLALLAREIRGTGQGSVTSMLSTMAHCLSEDVIEYEGRGDAPHPDEDLYGIGPLYRLYPAAAGWVFLAVFTDREWDALAGALDLPPGLRDDPDALATELGKRFVEQPASAWESALTALDVACVEVSERTTAEMLMGDDGLCEQLGMVREMEHPVLGTLTRPVASVTFSRSGTRHEGAPMLGQHTDGVLGELGYTAERIADLRARGVIA